MVGPSHPGTPTPSHLRTLTSTFRDGVVSLEDGLLAKVPLACLEMPFLALQTLTSRRTNPTYLR